MFFLSVQWVHWKHTTRHVAFFYIFILFGFFKSSKVLCVVCIDVTTHKTSDPYQHLFLDFGTGEIVTCCTLDHWMRKKTQCVDLFSSFTHNVSFDSKIELNYVTTTSSLNNFFIRNTLEFSVAVLWEWVSKFAAMMYGKFWVYFSLHFDWFLM